MKRGSLVRLASKIVNPSSRAFRNDFGIVTEPAASEFKENLVFWSRTGKETPHYDVELIIIANPLNEIVIRVFKRLLNALQF
jgi:hypothetical protein